MLSASHPPCAVAARVDAFLEAFARKLLAMNGDTFRKQRKALALRKLERAVSLAEGFWEPITDRRIAFQGEYGDGQAAWLEAQALGKVRRRDVEAGSGSSARKLRTWPWCTYMASSTRVGPRIRRRRRRRALKGKFPLLLAPK